ncbi:TonB-dependent receptor plug domain-containing protein [Reichenbachiella ulvae]|uniref:TonB-dependent receptor plug domain-containing protein n=1 Tax=Reichenbachiella ulvae TaxID=2980104 RepID=A0ABT3CX64_9BACT|nr:TonB-dependent receptor plug domain-containing protein [Reichenbachiella ulvae]MCV9388286.1 TonB-dependent receptor plug domain-containing protein [Reichenbachiella ulvae]
MYWRKIMAGSLALFCQVSVWAQEMNIESALNKYEQEQGIKFSFDPQLIGLVDAKVTYQQDLSDFVSELESILPLEVKRIENNYFIIRATERAYYFQAYDSLDQVAIAPTDIMVLVNAVPQPIDYQSDGIRLLYKPNLSDTVLLYAVGYEKRLISPQQFINQSRFSIPMMNISVELKGLVIKEYLTKGIDLDPTSQSVKIDVEDLPLLPGETDGDIFASIAALPGVTSPDQRAGNLFIRGSYTDQSLVLFDNIPIYHRGHYYGTISPYNPKIVSNVSVYRNGFHPRLGNRVGGAVIIESDQQIYDESHVGIGANSLFATGYGKAKLAEDKVSLSVAARRSYPRDIQSPKLKAISESVFSGTGLVDSAGNFKGDIDLIFQDYHTKINYHPNEKHQLALSAIYTNNHTTYTNLGRSEESEDINQFSNSGYNLNWTAQLNPKWSTNTSITYSDFSFKYSIDPDGDGDSLFYSNNRIKDLNLKEEFKLSLQEMELDLGIDYNFQAVGTEYANIPPKQNQIYRVDEEDRANYLSPYFNLNLKHWEKWDIQLGTRATYYAPLDQIYWDPRAFVNYTPADWVGFRASAGWYHQYLSQVKYLEFTGGGFDNELWVLANDKGTNVINGRQFTLGSTIYHSGWIIDVEAYEKLTGGVSVSSGRSLRPDLEIFGSSQWIKGFDAMIKKQFNSQLNVWASYSYSQSEITLDTAKDLSFKAKYVQPHVFYLGSAYQNGRWKLSAAYKWSTGLYQKSLDMVHAELIFLNRPPRPAPTNPPPPGSTPPPPPPNPFAELNGYYDPISSLDLSASYTLPRSVQRDWSASLGLSLVNILNNSNLIDRVFRADPEFNFIDRYGIGFAPNLMLIVEF